MRLRSYACRAILAATRPIPVQVERAADGSDDGRAGLGPLEQREAQRGGEGSAFLLRLVEPAVPLDLRLRRLPPASTLRAGARRRTSLSAGPGAAFRRIARHKGGAVAVFATARQLARLIYRMLRYGHNYVDIGEQAYDRRFQIRRLAALTETAKSLGYTLVPNVAAG